MKQVSIFLLLTAACSAPATNVFAQKDTYDVVSYTIPNGWKKEVKENGVQIYTGNEKTGEYSVALIIHSAESGASASDNFSAMWEKLVKGTVTVSTDPTMGEPLKANGWDLISGQANYTDGANKGQVILLAATGNGKLATVVLMANTDKYQQGLEEFLRSLELSPIEAGQSGNSGNVQDGNGGGGQNGNASGGQSGNSDGSGNGNSASGTSGASGNSIVGIWESNILETSGLRFSNGSPMVTAGYFRHAYIFHDDGTYLFLEKDFSSNSTNIFFAYETGTWAVDGTHLTISPASGKNETWSKSASGSNKEWGKLLKATPRKLEKISYAFGFHYYSGTKETYMELKYNKATERDGNPNQANIWSYRPPYTPGQPIIDLPPGEKIGGTSPDKKKDNALAGKIWEGSSKEKFTGGTMNGYNTGGFFTYQYTFGKDGTYRFVYIGASAYTDANTLQYESGTYSVNGDQLTIQPVSGSNEEWSVVGGPVKLSAMSDVQINKIKSNWGKKLKSAARKLEKYVYTFKVEYMDGNHANALVVAYNGETVREGKGGKAYYYETSPEGGVKMPPLK